MSLQPTAYEKRLLKEYWKRHGKRKFPFSSLEELLESPSGFGIDSITDAQRILCRIIEGRPLKDLADSPLVADMLACNAGELPKTRPSEMVITAGVRTAKTMIAAGVALIASQIANLDGLSDGEIPRYSVVSLEKDNAKVLLAHLRGLLSKPALKPLVIHDAAERWKDLIEDLTSDVLGNILLWHPSGRPVEIRVMAGKRSGGSLVSRWSVGLCLDEAPRMVGATDGVVNYDDSVGAVQTRLRDGAQILSIGSPGPSYGPIYNIVQAEWGSPTTDRVVFRSTGPQMNPIWWTPERCESIRVKNPTVYVTDVLGRFADGDEQLFVQHSLEICSRENVDILYQAGHDYRAAMDPATRSNSWTFTIGDRVGNKKRIVYAREWQGTASQKLRPIEVLTEISIALKSYGLDWVTTDQWSVDAIRDLAQTIPKDDDAGTQPFAVMEHEYTQKELILLHINLSKEMEQGMAELPNDPLLMKDFKLVRKKGGASGPRIVYPKTSDKRHCDYVPTAILTLAEWISDVIVEIVAGSKEAEDLAEQEQLEKEIREIHGSDDWMERWGGCELPESLN